MKDSLHASESGQDSKQATTIAHNEDFKWSSGISMYVTGTAKKASTGIGHLVLQEGMEKKVSLGSGWLWKMELREETGTEVGWHAVQRSVGGAEHQAVVNEGLVLWTEAGIQK